MTTTFVKNREHIEVRVVKESGENWRGVLSPHQKGQTTFNPFNEGEIPIPAKILAEMNWSAKVVTDYKNYLKSL